LRFLVNKAPAYLPSALLDNGSQLASAILDQLLKPVLVQGLVLMVIGAAMVAGAIIAQRIRKKNPSP